MADWKKSLRMAAVCFLLGILSILILYTVYQGWAQKLESRWFTTVGFLLIAGLLVLLWKRLSLESRVQLLATYLIFLIGFFALYYTPQAKGSFLIGPFTLSFLVNLLIFLSLSLALFFLLWGLKLSRNLKIAIGAFGLICSIPFLIGLIKDIPLDELLRGAGFFKFIPWFLQPAFLGVVLLLPILLIFLIRDLWRASRDERRSTFRSSLNLFAAFIPLVVGVLSIAGQTQSGVVTRYFSDHQYGSFKKQEIAELPQLDWKSPPVVPAAGERFWVEWEGVLNIPKDGEYQFKTEGEGFLYLDGKRVFGDRDRSGKIPLKAGKHLFRAAAIESKKEGKFLLQMKAKDDETFHPIDPKQLSYQDSQARWRRTPRQAAQVGIDWLQSASYDWQESHRCFGCHVQGQVLMGLSVARKNNYAVNPDYFKKLFDFSRDKQNEDGTYHSGHHITATGYASMGMSYAQDLDPALKNPNFIKSAQWLATHQENTGEFPIDHREAPIDQGSIMTTANSVFTLMQAFKESGEDKFKQAAERALAWVAAAPAETTQDKIYQVLVLSQFGSGAQKDQVAGLVEQLKKEQAGDGGWMETPQMKGSNAYATGQVLYAFKKAGVSINSPEFIKGVRFLMDRQKMTGAWPAENTQTHRPSEFAPTMWAVIGLAGSFGEIMPEILEPKDRSSVQGTVALKAQVTNFTESEIASVDFEVDGKPLGNAQQDPKENLYQIPWNTDGLPSGEHKIRVVAANKAGQKGEAISTAFTGIGVKVKITQPTPGSLIAGPQPVQALAEGLYGQTIRKVEFLANGAKIGELTEGAGNNLYGVTWDPSALPEGNYQIQAIATNSTGQQAQDSIQVVKKQPLGVKILTPGSGEMISGLVNCTAQVTNNTQIPVSHVEFFLDGENSMGRSLSERMEVPCNFTGAALGNHTLKAVVTNQQGMTAMDSIPILVGETKGPGYLKVQLKNLDEAGGEQVLYFPPDVIELIFDMSGSMWEQMQGKAKIEIAREVLDTLVRSFPKDANLGLRVYGHRSKSDCKDSELMVPFGKVEPDAIMAKVNAIKPKGMTLIDFSLREALKDLQAQQGSKILILVTDGIETCKGDPVKAAQDLVAAGLKMKIHVVGFDIARYPEAVEQLKKVAEFGQGKFYTAENSQQMSQAPAEAVKVSYSVFDADNKLLYTKPLGTESNELMSGNYRIEVALEPPLVLNVKIEKGKTSTVEVIKQNKAFRIESSEAIAAVAPPVAPAASPIPRPTASPPAAPVIPPPPPVSPKPAPVPNVPAGPTAPAPL